MKLTKKTGIFLLLLLTACGSDNPTAVSTPTLPSLSVNDAGFPNVAGHYSFNTSEHVYSCDNRETKTYSAFPSNLDVMQTTDKITLQNAQTFFGTFFKDFKENATAFSGNVQRDSNFLLARSVTIPISKKTSETIEAISIIENISGLFIINGWSGTYSARMHSPVDSCTVTATFSGDKIR